jgi:DNA uptake protein ComE-like DNA-binding protein
MAGPALRLLGLPVDVNHGSVEDLEALPGIGPKLAERLVRARPFAFKDDLQRVPGIGKKRWAQLQPLVVAGPP